MCTALGIDYEAKQQVSDNYNYAAFNIADNLYVNTRMSINNYTRTDSLAQDMSSRNEVDG
jgi:hypothetical protein